MRSNIKIIHLRRKAAQKQSQRCYYCDRRMTPHRAQLNCTAEHLVPRSSHGKDTRYNIVAACKFCNAMRHRQFSQLSPLEYSATVKGLLHVNKWHEHHPAWKSLA